MSMESHGVIILRGENRRTRRKPVPVPLCSLQIPHGLTWTRARASAVRGRRLTAWAMARPHEVQLAWGQWKRHSGPPLCCFSHSKAGRVSGIVMRSRGFNFYIINFTAKVSVIKDYLIGSQRCSSTINVISNKSRSMEDPYVGCKITPI
jgi:hypothetical protein